MAMSVELTLEDGSNVMVRASGGYSPDVMHDLQNRAAVLLSHVAGVNVQVAKALETEPAPPADGNAVEFDPAPTVNDTPVYEDADDE